MARYLYSELSSLIQARANCAKHKYTCKSVIGGWQTERVDGTSIGPIFNKIEELWNWQSSNLTDRTEWFEKHEEKILDLVKEHMPCGSGFDAGTKLDFDASHAEKLVFNTSFHHMNDVGYYDGWTQHTVTVTPSFNGFNLRISGPNRNDIKEYIHEMFADALNTEN